MRAARALVLAAVLLLAACASPEDRVRDHLDSRYGTGTGSGDMRTWTADEPVGTVTAGIVRVAEPAARAADGGAEYLRYDDDIVTVMPAAGGGSRVTTEDLDGRYRSGGFVFLGPGFTPGSPAGGGDGGPGDAK